MKQLIPLSLATLAACAPEKVESLKIETSPSAICSTEETLLDQLNTTERLGTWIQESIDKNANPEINLGLERDSLNAPEQFDNQIPGNIEAFGVFSRLHELDPEWGVYLLAYQEDGSYWFFAPTDGVSCDDLSSAYQIKEFPVDVTITSQCELKDDLVTCKGTFYKDCPIDHENPLGPYDCTVVTNFEDAPAEYSASAEIED